MEKGILGPEGTFSETAARLWLDEDGRNDNFAMRYYETIFDVSRGVLKKEVNYGIVPIENSLEGSVGDTLDVLSSSGTKAAPTGKDKTSIRLYVKERPGALYEVLGEFALRGLNPTKIESRPSKRALGDSMFYIDCEGHIEEAEIQEALKGVKKKATMLKILGTYPIAIRK